MNDTTRTGGGPLVSIGLPVYNGAAYLREAIASLLSQSYRNIELIVCDNASTDGTAEIVAEFAGRDTRVRCYRHPENIGGLPNFNFALARAAGEYFMWAADDDVWDPEFVATLLPMLRGTPGAALAVSGMRAIDPRGEQIPGVSILPGFRPPVSRLARLAYILLYPEWASKACVVYGLMRADAIRAAGGYLDPPYYYWGADNLIVFRLAVEGPLLFTPEPLLSKRFHDESEAMRVPVDLGIWGLDRYQWDYLREGRREILKARLPLPLRVALLPVWLFHCARLVSFYAWTRRRLTLYLLGRRVRRAADSVYERLPSPLVQAYRAIKGWVHGRGSAK